MGKYDVEGPPNGWDFNKQGDLVRIRDREACAEARRALKGTGDRAPIGKNLSRVKAGWGRDVGSRQREE